MLPQVKRALPEAKLPMQSPRVLASMLARRGRRARPSRVARLRPMAQELLVGPALARAGGARAARRRARRVSRRRAHLDRHATSTATARRRSTSAAAAISSGRSSRRRRSATCSRASRRVRMRTQARARGAVRRGRRVDRDLRLDDAQPRQPRRRRRSRSRATSCSTASPPRSRRPSSSRSPRPRLPRASRSSMARAEATQQRLAPEIFDLPVEKMRAGWYTDAYFNHTRDDAARGRPPPARRHAGLPEAATPGSAAWTRRSRSSSSARTTATASRSARSTTATAIEPYEPVMHDRGRLHDVRASRDAVPRHARAADADHDERRARARGGERQADHLHAGAARPPPHPDGRRLRRLSSRGRSSAPRSASRPTSRRRGGAAAASARCRTR